MTTPSIVSRRRFPRMLAAALAASCAGCMQGANAPPAAVSTAATPGAADVYCTGLVDVEGGVVQVFATRGGVVAEAPVAEGDRVAAGQLLLKLADDAERLAVKAAQCRLLAAEEAAAVAAAEPEQFRLQVLQGEAMIRVLESRFDNLRLRLDTTRSLADLKQASRIDVLTAEGLVEETARLLEAERAKLDALRLTDPARRGNEAQRQIEAARIALSEAELASSHLQLRSPCAARVLQVNAVTSSMVAPGHPAVILQPERPLIVRIPVDAEFAERVAPGMTAEVRPDAGVDAARPWRGTVSTVGGWFTTRRPVGPEIVTPGEERTVECVVKLDDTTDTPPRIGLKVRVRIDVRPPAAPSSPPS